jgi:TusE/DsrC/DsvC family sulfur relay protein
MASGQRGEIGRAILPKLRTSRSPVRRLLTVRLRATCARARRSGVATNQGEKSELAGLRAHPWIPAPPVLMETRVEVNERGFMTDPSQWTPGAALYLARRQGVPDWLGELTGDHWRVIQFMRLYYQDTGNAPSLRYTCKALSLTKRKFRRFFPGGLMAARRISGLPGSRRAAGRGELSGLPIADRRLVEASHQPLAPGQARRTQGAVPATEPLSTTLALGR